jgi:hypothetical protein
MAWYSKFEVAGGLAEIPLPWHAGKTAIAPQPFDRFGGPDGQGGDRWRDSSVSLSMVCGAGAVKGKSATRILI